VNPTAPKEAVLHHAGGEQKKQDKKDGDKYKPENGVVLRRQFNLGVSGSHLPPLSSSRCFRNGKPATQDLQAETQSPWLP